MKTIEKFLSHVRKKGVKIGIEEGDRLRISAPEHVLTPELGEELSRRKPEILSFLKQFRSDSAFARTRILPAPKNQEIPLSFSQQRLWFLDQQEEGKNAAYNVQIALHFAGPLDIKVLEKSIAEIINRHESLRTTFPAKNGLPVQKIADSLSVPLPVKDLQQLSASEQDKKVQQTASQEARKDCDLAQGPLIRTKLLRLAQKSHVLLTTIHHIVCDAWSMTLFRYELTLVYEAFSCGKPCPLPGLPVQYADYTCWQQEWMAGEILEKEIGFWKQRLDGAPSLLELPTDRPRPPVQTFQGRIEYFNFDAELTRNLKFLSRNAGASLFMTVFSGFAALLSRYSSQEDIVVGFAVANRNHKEVEPLIGFFTNNLLLRIDLSGNPTLGALLNQVKDTTLEVYDHSELPFEKLVEAMQPERNPSHTPLVQVAFSWIDFPVEMPELPNLEITSLNTDLLSAKLDLVLYMRQDGEGLTGALEYNTDLFDGSTIRRMISHFEYLLTNMVENPDQRIKMVPLFKQEIADSLGIPVSRIEKLAPLTPTQRDLYLDHMINPDSTVYSLGVSVDLGTQLDRDIWKKAVSIVCKHDDIIKTRYCIYKNEPYQFIDRDLPVNYEFIDFTIPDALINNFEKIITERIKIKYDFNAQQLFNNILVKNTDGHYIAILAVPHIVLDGYSAKIFFERVGLTYEALLEKRIINKKNPSFYDYIGDALHCFDSKEIWKYWYSRLNGITPLCFQMGFSDKAKNVLKTIRIAEEQLKEIRDYCKVNNFTLAVYFRSLYGILLNGYVKPSENIIAYEVIGARAIEHRMTLGCFYHTLPILFTRNLFNLNASLTDYFEYIKNYRRRLGSLQNISLFLLKRILKNESLKFFYNFINFETVNILGKTLIQRGHDFIPDNQVHFVINDSGDELLLTIRYNEKFFSDLNFLERILSLSKQITSGCTHLYELDILLETEQQQITEWNDTRAEYPKDKYIHHLFEEQAKKRPDIVALVFEDEQLSYGELNIRANQLSHYLQTLGVGPEMMVGICVERSLEMLIGLMGILKAGGAYVPLDPSYPKERVAFMLEDSQVSVLLTQKRLLPELPEYKKHIICLDSEWPIISQNSEENPISNLTLHNLAYMIYTSGTTGRPKGAMNTHLGILNRLLWMQEAYQLTEKDHVLQKTPFSFDVSVWEFFWPLMTGARLVIAKPDGHKDTLYLARLITEQEITTLHFVPPMLQLFTEEKEIKECSSIRQVICSGEALPFELQERFFSCFPNTELHNLYGPTEAAIDVSFWQCKQDDPLQKVPIGCPIANIQLYILDAHLRLVPVGLPGELHIGGVGLARGYYNRPELTDEKFIHNPFSDEPDARLYKTGDMVCYLSDGNIEYLGRIDHQVKIRGFRIELGEIEAILTGHPAVQEAVVIDREYSLGDKRLVAYFVPDQETSNLQGSENFADFLKKSLPDYMVPSAFVKLEAMPLTPNGKTDRRALPEPDMSGLKEDYIAPRNHLEMRLVQIWENILKVRPIGAGDSFFNLGGHSLLAVRLLSHIQQKFGQNLPLSIFFQSPTIEHLANILRVETDISQTWSPLVPIQPNGSKQPFFCVPGQGGNVVYLYNLARHIGTDQPFFSFQALGLDGESEPHARIKDMASCYIEEMQTVQPSGPYNLSGHSFGAFVAFEMAQQLQTRGQTVDLLAILDIPAILPRNHPIEVERDDAQWLTDIARVIEGLSGKTLGILYESLTSLDWNQQLNFLKERMETANLLPSGSGISQVRGIVQVIKTAELALSRYKPRTGYANQITLFRTAKPIQDKYGILNNDPDDETWGWSQLSTKPVKVIHLPGDHGTLMGEPHVQVLAEAIKDRVKG